jgi:hypothetical protein
VGCRKHDYSILNTLSCFLQACATRRIITHPAASPAFYCNRHQIAELTAHAAQQQQQPGSLPPPLDGLLLPQSCLPPAPYLLSVAEEAAAREAARWEPQVAALQEVSSRAHTALLHCCRLVKLGFKHATRHKNVNQNLQHGPWQMHQLACQCCTAMHLLTQTLCPSCV